MKKTAISLVLLFSLFSLNGMSQEHRVKVYSKTYSLLPGKTLNLVNKNFRVFEVRSEYPIQLAAGACHNDYTVQWRCNLDSPVDLFVRDLRNQPVFSTPKANSVVVSFVED